MGSVLFALLGTAGRLALEAKTLPQIGRLFRRKRADDVSSRSPALDVAGRLRARELSFHQARRPAPQRARSMPWRGSDDRHR